jgi:hypothetical protein
MGLILGLAGFIYVLILKKKDPLRLLFLYFLVFTLIHPLVYESLFQTLIKYKVQPRYYLSLTPVLIAGLAVGLHYALSFLTHWIKKYKSRFPGIKYIPHGLVLVLFFSCFYGNLRSLSETYMIQNREWEKVYELFKYHSAPGDTAYIFNLCRPGKWVPTYFYSQKFYYNDESQRYVGLKPTTNIGEDFQNIANGKQKGNVFLVVLQGQHRLTKSDFENFDDITIHPYYKVFIARFFNNGMMPENIMHFFYCLARKFPKWENFYMVYETLFKLEMGAGNLRKAGLHLKTLKKIARHDKLKRKIKKFEKEWQHKKTQRIKRLEKRKSMKRNVKK